MSRDICGISPTRGKDLRKYCPQGFEPEEEKATDWWCRSKFPIDGFDLAFNNIDASFLKVGDESMSAIRFWTPAKGNLPHLSYIFHKTEPLGT